MQKLTKLYRRILYTFRHTIFLCYRIYWFLVRPRTFGVKVIISSGDQILMIRNTYGAGLWTFPGGKIEKGESAIAAARREVLEEVGLELSSLQECGSFVYTGQYKHDNITVFIGETVKREFKIDPIEIEEAKWFDIKSLPNDIGKLVPKYLEIAGV